MWKFIIFRPVSFPFAFTMSERLTQPTMSNCLTTKAPRRSWRWLFGALLSFIDTLLVQTSNEFPFYPSWDHREAQRLEPCSGY
uniref:Putative secreted protein n=1 Tax=Anopheles marajoara TaxID=58244 RepID=A0A2M4CB48_9DIPT